MDKDTLLTLLKEFDTSSAVSLKYKEGETEFVLKKDAAYKVKPAAQIITSAPTPQHTSPALTPSIPTTIVTPIITVTTPENTDDNLITIKSPIVATFYRQPSPDAPVYVEKNSPIKKGSPLCILEAMKMMNTLESEYDGIIESILAHTGDLVEFDQPLFTIRVK